MPWPWSFRDRRSGGDAVQEALPPSLVATRDHFVPLSRRTSGKWSTAAPGAL